MATMARDGVNGFDLPYASLSAAGANEACTRTRFGSMSETITVSSTNPVCLFKMGRTLSSMLLQSSRAFPDLLVISTTRVNMESTPFGWETG